MSNTEFVTTYLREKGVQTPVSLDRLGNKKSNIDNIKDSTAQVLSDIPMTEDASSMLVSDYN